MADEENNQTRISVAGESTSAVRLYPPKMNRSQPQLATSYAPGSVFTWEGGKGACLSVPVDAPVIEFADRATRRVQIMDALEEYCQNWLARGMNISRTAPVYQIQLLDDCFFNAVRNVVEIATDQFAFMRPEKVGYIPGPLVYRCDYCHKVKEYISAAHQIADPLPHRCSNDEGGVRECKWRQLDVVYVHWSGEIEGLSPFRYTMARNGEVRKLPRCQCGAADFKLLKNGNQFSRWRFRCTGCGAEKEVYQTDPFSLSVLKPQIDNGVAHQWSEINMIPVSYRASPVFYVQSARFIVYDSDPEVISLMHESRHEDLTAKIASLHGFGNVTPTDERIKQQLEANGQGGQWLGFAHMRQNEAAARASGNDALAETFAEAARLFLTGWYQAGHVVPEAVATPQLISQVRSRGEYARRFDPIRSTIEHDSLHRRKLALAAESHDLKRPHVDLGGQRDAQQYIRSVEHAFERSGISEGKLIKNLDMVEFSFGFTRVSSTPATRQKDVMMPVRLKGFPPLRDNRRPIYVIEQQNESLYFRLNADLVASFLEQNGVLPVRPVLPRTLGSTLIEDYEDFGLFLQDFRVRDAAARVRSRSISSLTYLLLHTLAHHVIHGIARFSGLDLGSMSEAIFPADLAFLVHRRGMTEDLGNLSSMWRDNSSSFLNYFISRRELRCGSGTLCDQRGGACPACLMIPETSCIAGNQLLSRSILVGGRAPQWDINQTPLIGFFEVVNAGINR